ncbi:DUF302 domain-containing protein [Halosolutus halophilus]|uniref:DUF302 domain-containing protein n=1 Tax=Halosolutus halophilus TaxID=1552990 RepID=UPI003CE4D7DE
MRDALDRRGQKVLGEVGDTLLVGNPGQAHKALAIEPDVAVFVPLSVTISEEGDETHVRTVRPSTLLAFYGDPDLRDILQEMELLLWNALVDGVPRRVDRERADRATELRRDSAASRVLADASRSGTRDADPAVARMGGRRRVIHGAGRRRRTNAYAIEMPPVTDTRRLRGETSTDPYPACEEVHPAREEMRPAKKPRTRLEPPRPYSVARSRAADGDDHH